MNYSTRVATANLTAVMTAAAAYLLFKFPPLTSGFYPRCPVFTLLHLYCPGCGGTRAVAALLHGKVAEAMHWNAMIVMLLPLIAILSIVSYCRAMQKTEFHWPFVPARLLALVLVCTGIFTVLRNVPKL